MILTETILAPLGSRFSINFRPQRRDVRVSALGRFLDYVGELEIGVRLTDGRERVLPFCAGGDAFEYCEQELTATSITFKGRSVALACMIEVTFTRPFYPRDVRLCTAPFFYVDIRVSRIRDMVHWQPIDKEAPTAGTVFFRVRRPGAQATVADGGLVVRTSLPLKERNTDPAADLSALADEERHPAVESVERIEPLRGPLSAGPDGLEAPFDVSDGRFECSLVWGAYVSDPVLEDMGTPTRFKYTSLFPNIRSVLDYAASEEETIRRRTRLLDSILTESSLGKTQRDFIAYTLQSYLSNTWWTVRPDGADWFSVWEGVCLFNSTVDVEYNLGLFYHCFWPELLEITFAEWERHLQPGGYLSHDMGGGLKANGQSYPHPMEVEENSNFVLMLYALWRWTGSDAPVRRHGKLLGTLVEYLLAADTTGNGFPNVGVANTVDDASPAVQFAREQTYLAVKCLCALDVAADMLCHLGNEELAARCRDRVAVARETLDRDAWLGDHYAVCLDRRADGLEDIWGGGALPEGELFGWDAYSLYTSNGMLYPLIVGRMPPVDIGRIRQDLEASLRESRIEYGCTHSSADKSNVWVSQNLWRDLIAAYLGVDCLDMVDGYWAFLLQENTQREGRCFIDTYVANNLCYYPRGITSIGVLIAALGLRLDRVAKEFRVDPVRVPCRLPLLPFCDWDNEEIAWVRCRRGEDGSMTTTFTGPLPREYFAIEPECA